MADVTRWMRWRDAMADALYGPNGFYRQPEGPAAHFRTSAHTGRLFATALSRLAREAGATAVVDVGAGGGELLAALHDVDPGLALHGVDVVPRPPGLPPSVAWSQSLPPRMEDVLVVANEWLDTVACDVVTVVDGTWRLVLVDPGTGMEATGPPPGEADAAWLDRWWPAGADGDRAEVGRRRDEAWAEVVQRVSRGLLVAIDYAHDLPARAARRFADGTLTGYRHGLQVRPVPDGTCDVTAHVALDAVAAAGLDSGAAGSCAVSQRDALKALGVDATRPPLALASADPRRYLAELTDAGVAAELRAPGGLGDFAWLLQAVDVDLPAWGQRTVTARESSPRMM